ncbi:MAG: thiamine diphosphokinase [Ilumatobacteraceae bacterium]
MSKPATISSMDHRVPTTVVVIGGDAPRSSIKAALPVFDYVIAADSGLHGAIALGLVVDAVVGDMDSVDELELGEAQTAGTIVDRAPTNKDATDTELALLFAAERGAKRIVVVTGGGGRLDHQLGVLNVLFHPRLANIYVEMFWDTAHVIVLRGPGSAVVNGRRGEIVGLLPLGQEAIGITTEGLAWPLDHETLAAYSTRGVSNELVDTVAHVSLTDGHLLIIRPHALES